MAPLAAFVLAATSVRTRRSAANMAMLGAVVALGATLLTLWGLTRKATLFEVTYSYLNITVAVTGPSNFQGFGIDLILHVDRLTAFAMLVIELCVIGALGWHRVMGRTEPGAARFHALVSVFLFGALAALVSRDLAELFAFWGLAGAATYLLLAHRWTSDEASRTGRIALALPFLSDLSLLSGIAVLYSRYGTQNLAGLIPILHTTHGVGAKTLAVASGLIFAGIAGRLALWPLHSWITSTATTSPGAASAMAQSVWSVVAITVLYRLMPIIVASNSQTLRACLYACGVAAVAAPLLSLIASEPRRAIAMAGSGVAAIGGAVVVHGSQNPRFTFAVLGVACVLAAAPARAAAMLAATSIAVAMRTEDLAEVGGGWSRMRASTVALLIAGLAIGLSACGALAYSVDSRSKLGYLMGEAVLLVSIAALRVGLAVAIGPLRRRRAFEPDRVREAPPGSLGWPYWLALGGAVLAAAPLVNSWVGFLDGHKHPMVAIVTVALWAAVVVIGLVVTALPFAIGKDGALRVSADVGGWIDGILFAGNAALSRFILSPAADVTDRLGVWIPAGDSGLARSAAASGRLALAAARAPALPLLVGLAVLIATAVALLSQGVFR